MPIVKDFYQKVRYPLDLGAAKPVKRPTIFNYSDKSCLGITPDRVDRSDKLKSKNARSD